MRIRFYNAKILTMNHNTDIMEGELWINGNTIEYIGDSKDSSTIPVFDREIDVEQNLIMPGFKNAHTHSAMTFLRSSADDMPLLDWLEKQVFPMEAKLTREHVYTFTCIALMEYLTSGITANFDMYLYPEIIAQASVDMGFRTVLCGGISGNASSCEEMAAQYRSLNQFHELISYKLGFHAEYTASDELLQKISTLANREKASVYSHNSESIAEVNKCLNKTGMTPTARIASFGIYNHGGGAYHGVHLTEDDMKILKQYGVHVISNPSSNCKLASGIAPLVDMEQNGLLISLGTDGPASNNCLDMFREMFLGTAMQKIATGDASAMDATNILKMATTNGARAMGLEKCTCLKEGYLADLILMDLNQPNMQPINNIVKNIVYSGSKQNIKLTMINGRILYEDGKFFTGIEPKEIYAKANKMVTELKA